MKRFFEFSKIILAVIFLILLGLTIYVCWLVRVNAMTTGDIDNAPLTQLIIGWFAAFTTAIGFYYSKAKAENKIKLKAQYGVEITQQDFDVNNGY